MSGTGGEKILPDSPTPKPGLVMSNYLLRSPVFSSARQRGNRLRRGELLASPGGTEIRYSGPTLLQTDLDVWHAILKLQDGGVARFSANHFLQLIGRPQGNSGRKWLKDVLGWLQMAQIEVASKNKNLVYSGQLIAEFRRVNEEGCHVYEVRVNSGIAALFGWGRWTAIDLATRQKLANKPLALWLHAFYSTHRDPFHYSLEKIRELCGSSLELRFFRRCLEAALAELANATDWRCALEKNAIKVNRKKTDLLPPTMPPPIQKKCQSHSDVDPTRYPPEMEEHLSNLSKKHGIAAHP